MGTVVKKFFCFLFFQEKKVVKILNFGSCNIDLVYTLDHIAVSGETESTLSLRTYPGGKGLNQSVAAAKAGAKIYHAGLVGQDGQELLDIMQKNGVDTTFVKTVNEKSGHAIIQVTPEGENSIITYSGANRNFTQNYIDGVLESFGKNDILLLQNEINLVPYIVDKAHAKGMRIVLNPSPADDDLKKIDFGKLTYLILNEFEAKGLTGTSDADASIMYLSRLYPNLKIMLTLGSKGCVYADGSERIFHPAFKVDVIDKTAAGTTFAGYFIAAISKGETVYDAIRFASGAAALSVSRKGAAPSIPSESEVLDALKFLRPTKTDSESENQVKQIIGYLETHITDARLDELASLLGYSSVYTSGLIKKLIGKTFSALLQEKRCHIAIKLLRETDMPIEEIIFAVGYENESFFRRIFRETYGISPLKYRKKNR